MSGRESFKVAYGVLSHAAPRILRYPDSCGCTGSPQKSRERFVLRPDTRDLTPDA